MSTERYIDTRHKRLVYIRQKADSHFWDSHWDRYEIRQVIQSAVVNRAIIKPTLKYLHRGARILEGGCGLGQNVWSLAKAGYDAYGVDYADTTVKKVNQALPELNISCQDIRKLDFEDGYFDGYWSLGVIEHFYNGYDDIIQEIRRVLRTGGYLFLTFPCLSKLRHMKSLQGSYGIWEDDDQKIAQFYQFAFNDKSVASTITQTGFQFVSSKPISGFKGFKDEIETRSIRALLQRMYDSDHLPVKALVWIVDHLLAPFSGHCQFMIFRAV